MTVDEIRAHLARGLGASGLVIALAVLAPPTFAQDPGDDDDTADAGEQAQEEIVVTGSRLKRDTFSSVAPLQVISGQVSREIGSIDPSDILQDSTAAAGQQIDITFQGFVLDNGPGSATIDLRGLGASRTLVLINGRRAAPVGVEGDDDRRDSHAAPPVRGAVRHEAFRLRHRLRCPARVRQQRSVRFDLLGRFGCQQQYRHTEPLRVHIVRRRAGHRRQR